MSAPVKREHAVFINCPYDRDFRPTFHAIVLATLCCGFTPRVAAADGGTVARYQRIQAELRGCGCSIHDLSRCRGEGTHNLARFNMPLELGIALGQRYEHADDPRFHNWLVLKPADYDVQRYISDLNGFDLREYDGTVAGATRRVLFWLGKQYDLPRAQLSLGDIDRVAGDGVQELTRRARVLDGTDSVDEGWPYLTDLCARLARDLGLGVAMA